MPTTSSFTAAIAAFAPTLPLLVAYSGGADSTALLVACHRKWPGQVRAVHVHHGLQAAADDFASHCEQQCARLHIPLTLVRLDARHAKGESPEDAARNCRYAALMQVATELNMPSVALAQHQNDQVETVLLALSRGAGLPGLAAMPQHWMRGTTHYHRPLLQVPAAQLRQWLQEQDIACIEDPSNHDIAYTRNHIRHQLIPALARVFPGYATTFTRSAAHAAQAQTLVQELAVQDLSAIGNPPSIAGLQTLSEHRQANVLRYWLKCQHHTSASAAQLRELQRQIGACTTKGHAIDLKIGQGKVMRQGLVLHWYNLKAASPSTKAPP